MYIEEQNKIIKEALIRIMNWEMPETGEFWDPPHNTRPMSYESAFGSNGVRDYIRALAQEALNKTEI